MMVKEKFRYSGGKVDQRTVEAALDFLVAIEPDPEEFAAACARKGLHDQAAEYEKIITANAESIELAQAALRQFGQQITPPTPEAMRIKFYEITNLPKYRASRVAASVTSSKLRRAWRGVNGWQV